MIRFHNFKIDPETRELFNKDQKVNIQKKAFDLLIFLIENRDRAVSKDELLESLWENRVVSEGVLAHAVTKLRNALNDQAKNSSIIRTVHGYGLQFIAHVFEESETDRSEQFNQNSESQQNKPQNPVPKKNNKLITYLGGTMFVFVAVLLVFLMKNHEVTSDLEPDKESEIIPKFEISTAGNWQTVGFTHLMNEILLYSRITETQIGIETTNKDSDKAKTFSKSLLINFVDGLVNIHINDSIKEINIDDLVAETRSAIDWICQTTNEKNPECKEMTKHLDGISDLAIENYFRGVDALNHFKPVKAIGHFKISLNENPDFDLARIMISKSYYSASNYIDAKSELESLLETTSIQGLKNQALITLGKVHYSLSEYPEAEAVLNQVISSETVSAIGMNEAKLELSEVKRQTNQFDEAIDLATASLSYFQETNNERVQSKANEHLGSVYLTKGDLKEAKQHFLDGLRLAESSGMYEVISKCLTSLTLIHQREGNFRTALEYSLQKLKLIEKKGDASDLISSHISLTFLYLDLGDHTKAQKHAFIMWDLIQESNEPDSLFLGYYILGELASFRGDYLLAVSRMEDALRIAAEQKVNWRIAQVNCALAGFAINADEFEDARRYADECQRVSELNELRLFSAVALLNQGKINSRLNNFTVSKNQLEEVLQVGIEMDHDKLKYEVYLELIELGLQSGSEKIDQYIGSIPKSYHNDFQYIYAYGMITASKEDFNEALTLLLKAKSIAGDNWTFKHEDGLNSIRKLIQQS